MAMTSSWMWASLAASTTCDSGRVASTRATLLRIVAPKRYGCWVTMPSWLRSERRSRVLRSTPLTGPVFLHHPNLSGQDAFAGLLIDFRALEALMPTAIVFQQRVRNQLHHAGKRNGVFIGTPAVSFKNCV